jgi:hypothetical protein
VNEPETVRIMAKDVPTLGLAEGDLVPSNIGVPAEWTRTVYVYDAPEAA